MNARNLSNNLRVDDYGYDDDDNDDERQEEEDDYDHDDDGDSALNVIMDFF